MNDSDTLTETLSSLTNSSDTVVHDVLMDEALLRYYDPANQQTTYLQTEERDWLKKLTRIDALMKVLAKTTTPIASLESENQEAGLMEIKRTSLAVQLERLLWHFGVEHRNWCFPMFQFNPWVTLYFNLAAKHDLHEHVSFFNKTHVGHDRSQAQRWVETLNAFTRDAHEQAKSSEFKEMLGEFSRNEHNNFEGLRELVDRLFARYSRLLVVRVDLGFKKYSPALGGSASPKISDVHEAKRDLSKFLRKYRTKTGIFENIVGYAWKAEVGVRRGIHFHFLAFFDGSKVRQDISYGELLGQYWQNEVTKGEGHYYNCNRNAKSYRECGIGMISHADTDKRRILVTKVLPYLTKGETLLRLDLGKHYRAFGRSELPKGVPNKRGRHRAVVARN